MLTLEMSYPMYVISVAAMLDLDHMEPHQDMLGKGLVRARVPSMRGRTIFVSHEYSSASSRSAADGAEADNRTELTVRAYITLSCHTQCTLSPFQLS